MLRLCVINALCQYKVERSNNSNLHKKVLKDVMLSPFNEDVCQLVRGANTWDKSKAKTNPTSNIMITDLNMLGLLMKCRVVHKILKMVAWLS